VPVADTIKRVQGDVVVDTPARSDLVAVQTPQGFQVAPLRAAHAAPTAGVTDDAMVLERAGVAVRVVAGSPLAFKVTTPFDLAVAHAVKEQR
jgi:2-C-methyl-D-erythritol 4-phosphate cytidylyltransferase